MKSVLKILGLIIIVMGLSSCASGKDYVLEQNPPFKVNSGYFQKWVAGVQGGGSGTKVYISLAAINKDITVEELYFGATFLKAKRQFNNPDTYYADFLNDTNRDVIMDGEIINEAENTPPPISPFSLAKNEAVISYMLNDKKYYYKIANLEEKPLIAYPGANPNGRN